MPPSSSARRRSVEPRSRRRSSPRRATTTPRPTTPRRHERNRPTPSCPSARRSSGAFGDVPGAVRPHALRACYPPAEEGDGRPLRATIGGDHGARQAESAEARPRLRRQYQAAAGQGPGRGQRRIDDARPELEAERQQRLGEVERRASASAGREATAEVDRRAQAVGAWARSPRPSATVTAAAGRAGRSGAPSTRPRSAKLPSTRSRAGASAMSVARADCIAASAGASSRGRARHGVRGPQPWSARDQRDHLGHAGLPHRGRPPVEVRRPGDQEDRWRPAPTASPAEIDDAARRQGRGRAPRRPRSGRQARRHRGRARTGSWPRPTRPPSGCWSRAGPASRPRSADLEARAEAEIESAPAAASSAELQAEVASLAGRRRRARRGRQLDDATQQRWSSASSPRSASGDG